jgi:hypothetical protein
MEEITGETPEDKDCENVLDLKILLARSFIYLLRAYLRRL